MALRRMLLPLSLGLALLQCRAEPSRSRGSPSTTTPPPPLLPGPVDLTLAAEANASAIGNASAADHIGKQAAALGELVWSLCSADHAVTQIQAPSHLNDRGWKVDAIPLDRLLASGVLLDVSAEAAGNPGFMLSVAHLQDWEKKHGVLPHNSVLLIRFGWKRHAAGGAHPPTAAAPTHPGVTPEAAAHLVSKGRVVGVGVDLPALDPRGVGEPAARNLMMVNIYAVLNLNLSHELPAKGFWVLALPTYVRGASATSVRVVATARSPSLHASKSGGEATMASLACSLTATILAVVLTNDAGS